jgi:ferredoxin
MMTAMEDALQDWGVPKSKVHWEDFAPLQIDPKKAAAAGPSDVTVHFKKSGKEVAWDASHGPLRSFAFEHGVDIPISCGAGNCGSCLTAIRDGEVEYLAEPGFPDLDEGECLPCVCIPKTNLELDA